jgi:hypothetical protein
MGSPPIVAAKRLPKSANATVQVRRFFDVQSDLSIIGS